MDQTFYDTGRVIEASRKDLREFRANLIHIEQKCIAYKQAYCDERQRSVHGAQLYQALYQTHEGTLGELSHMAHKYRSLQREFEDAQTSVIAQDSVVQEYERLLAKNKGAEITSNAKDLELRVAQLEKENRELQASLVYAANLDITIENGYKEPEITQSIYAAIAAAALGSATAAESRGDASQVKKEDGIEVKIEEGAKNEYSTRARRGRKRKVTSIVT
jgi:hypothetical protein